MKTLMITRAAARDILAIWQHISRDSHDAADRVASEIELAMQELCRHPGMGHVRADGRPNLRFWRIHSYMIAYRVKGPVLTVSRVLHGARDFPPLFRRPH